MRSIYKYTLGWYDCTIKMPEGARILDIQFQRVKGERDSICGSYTTVLWAAVDTNEPMRDYKFTTINTGGEIPDDVWDNAEYKKSLQHPESGNVTHIFLLTD